MSLHTRLVYDYFAAATSNFAVSYGILCACPYYTSAAVHYTRGDGIIMSYCVRLNVFKNNEELANQCGKVSCVTVSLCLCPYPLVRTFR